ncbi:chitinase-like protein 1 [Tripterygium wilfordii]|uniref:Chitinase-like protein 1 n=1 Tax=Tripterygium wilfordii TaxID=458696 RepID=A0A7J7CIF2_TRIWF|nr:chitinase-like protein 1 [Tripterygium wilfordii]
MRGIFFIPVVAAVLLVLVSDVATADNGGSSDLKLQVKTVRGKKLCIKGWECREWSIHCCNLTISEYFQSYQFENLFSKRNSPIAKAVGFWDYFSFITAAAIYEPLGFGTTGGKMMQMKEIAAFLGHVGSKTSCGYGVATGGPLAWGLCYNRELSPSQSYCDDTYKYTYPCAPGAEYYGRGALPIYWYAFLFFNPSFLFIMLITNHASHHDYNTRFGGEESILMVKLVINFLLQLASS